ncbi:hypothetical protein K443DRAFT_643877 [Laccaria amethystina LaAM-08-1]|uniref:Uncharacterized protein n=1 Tax=Laccaria amethystina LaAM-08-1 TaxID=1095629 RepID=A0A0C9WIY0_9AGAR|nr:hypothetical protein K443DRAFT_643877 [Laccaria amethystina LaAM-08-1]
MRKGKKGQCRDARKPPIMPRGDTFVGLFLYPHKLSFNFSLAFVFLIPRTEGLRGSSADRVQVRYICFVEFSQSP